METARFDGRSDGFPALDLIAKPRFRSAASISFDLGRHGDKLSLPIDLDPGSPVLTLNMGPAAVFTVVGRLDVHHPSDGHIKAQLLVVLPANYHEADAATGLIAAVFTALGIPPDETYEALFIAAESQVGYEQPWDRDGMTDRMY